MRRFLRVAGIIAAIAVIACRAPALPGPEQVTGEWEKQEQTLPPIHLRLWLERDTLRARLRLSGSESTGTATFDGRELHLALSGREPLTGQLISPDELELRFSSGARAYRLRRTK